MAVTTTIIQQPPVELSPVKRPLQFKVQVSTDPTAYAAAIEVAVIVNGTQFGSKMPVEAFSFDNSGANSISLFNFNIAGRVQPFFDLDKFFPDLATPTVALGDSLQAAVSIEVYTYAPDSDGILQLEAGNKTSLAVPVINATRRAEETSSLEYYDPTATPTNPAQVRFLTRKPSRSILSLGDSEYLGLYAKMLGSMRVVAFDQDGVQQGDGQILLGNTFGEDELAILPVGPANINAIPTASWLSNTDQVTIDEDTRYYIIQAGWHCPDGSFNGYSDIRKYYVIPQTCRKHRLHFINSFGCPDSFSIWNNEKVNYVVESLDYTRSLPADFGIIAESAARQQAVGRLQIKSPISNITSQDRVWLAREFGPTAKARIEEGGQYIPVRIKAGTFPVADSDDLQAAISFTIEYSQQDIGISS